MEPRCFVTRVSAVVEELRLVAEESAMVGLLCTRCCRDVLNVEKYGRSYAKRF